MARRLVESTCSEGPSGNSPKHYKVLISRKN